MELHVRDLIRDRFFWAMVAFLAALIAIISVHGAMAGEQTRFYGADGRSMGTATTDSQGTTTFRDARGNVTGRASRPSR
jgi:ABC-type Na+ efflux pump permease subunit